MSDIALTAAQRSSLLSLRTTQSLSDRTQTRLSTGRSVNSVVDDAVNFFKAKSLTDRAADFDLRKGEIDQGISSVNSALQALDAIDSLMKQLKGVAEAARSQTTAERQSSTTQFNEIGSQIFQLVEDASYQGLNLLSATTATLDISFGVRTASKLKVSGLDLNNSAADTTNGIFSIATFSTGGSNIAVSAFGLSAGSFTSFGANNSAVSQATAMIQILDDSITRIRAHSSKLGSNVAILQTRLDFTENYSNTLTVGSDKLTLADLNEEGANLVALQTRQQLGIQSLSISGQQQQAILALIQ
ncbi:flagellin [Aestuariispira insulae]|uniref:Flagellin n=1 Tax=Aestuariispira insulae TaxID=1461337 RepID=A0A3D9HSP1_9PROT|nr:flagellin [Aestuariispira insulae]RED52435.1 flagellin-like protein [Aestuariispira insulae]